MPATLKITINQNDWNDQLKGWNCNALSVSCLAVVSVRVNGISPDPSFYVLEKENNLIRWTQPQRPEELVLLVKPIIDEQEDTETSKQVKLDTVLKFAAVVIPALIAAVSTITVTIINTKKEDNTAVIQQLNRANDTLSKEKHGLVLDLKEKEVTIDSLIRLIRLSPNDNIKRLVIKNDTLINENKNLKDQLIIKRGQLDAKIRTIASLEIQLNNLKNKIGNVGYTVYIHSSTQSNLFPTLMQRLKRAGFPEVTCKGLLAKQNQIIFYHHNAEAVANNAAKVMEECCQLRGMELILKPNATREKEIQIQLK